jgi:Tfp pilus assembly protein PilO
MNIKARINTLLAKFDFDNKTLLLIAIISLLFLYLNFSVIIKAQLNGLKNNKKRIAQLKKDSDTFHRNLARMQDFQKNKNAAVQPSPTQKTIIAEGGLALFLKQVSDFADKNKIILLQIKPSRETSAVAQAALEKITPFLVTLEAVGGYHNIGAFINALENAPVLISVSEIKISPREGEYLRQKATIVLRTYVKK